MSKTKKFLLIGGAMVLIVAGLLGYFFSPEKALGLASASFIKYTGDVMGTKTGTTTTGVMFAGNHTATSSYPIKIGNVSTAALFFQVLNASTSADVRMSILASNDDFCDTSTTTISAGYDVVRTGQINWFDAAPFLFNGNTAQTLTVGTSTQNWNTSGGAISGRTLLFTNLAAQCLRLDINASSTELRAEIRTMK